ncbi:hypothetical protein F5146DRAFT_999011 [Armillaria mellea]|nr:hypothetical protein F5146DRAFT_999011 [Armillaria mellea]
MPPGWIRRGESSIQDAPDDHLGNFVGHFQHEKDEQKVCGPTHGGNSHAISKPSPHFRRASTETRESRVEEMCSPNLSPTPAVHPEYSLGATEPSTVVDVPDIETNVWSCIGTIGGFFDNVVSTCRSGPIFYGLISLQF